MSIGTQTPLGNERTLLGAQGGAQEIRLLEANILQQDPARLWEAGAWVLSLGARNANPQSTAGALVNARITLGSGGAAIVFNVSVIQGTVLQLPGVAVSVDIKLPTAGSVDMVVDGILKPGFSSTSAHLLETVSMNNATVPQRGTLPNFARSVRVLGEPSNPIFCASTRIIFGNLNIAGPELRAASISGIWLPIGPGRVWSIFSKPTATEINYGVAAGTYDNQFDWEISL